MNRKKNVRISFFLKNNQRYFLFRLALKIVKFDILAFNQSKNILKDIKLEIDILRQNIMTQRHYYELT